MRHLKTEKIVAYLEDALTGEEISQVEEHLVSCDSCHAFFDKTRRMAQLIGKGIKLAHSEKELPGIIRNTPHRELSNETGCPDETTLWAYMDGQMKEDASQLIRTHVKECDGCFNALAYSFKSSMEMEGLPSGVIQTPTGWQEKALEAMTDNRVAQKPGQFEKMAHWITGSLERLNVFMPVPGYAVATVAAILLLLWTIPQGENIINITNSQRMVYTEEQNTGTLAFMNSEEEVTPYKGMEVKNSGKNLVFTWKPIPGGKVSEFALLKKGVEGDISMASLSVEGDVVVLPVSIFHHNEKYEWSISGFMEDGRKFKGIAEFVIGS